MKVCPRCGHLFEGEETLCPHCLSKKIVCAACGTENEPGSKFCINCGAKFAQRRICACGAKNSENSLYCYACGRPLEETDDLPPVKRIPLGIILAAIAAVFILLAIVAFLI